MANSGERRNRAIEATKLSCEMGTFLRQLCEDCGEIGHGGELYIQGAMFIDDVCDVSS